MRVILHAGAGKTGTTAIQNFLSLNNIALLKIGYYYPDPNISLVITAGNAEKIAFFLSNNRYDDCDALIRNVFEASLGLNCHTVIFSSEMLSDLSIDQLHQFKNVLKKYFSSAESVIYVRDIVDWCYSAYVQHVKRLLVTDSFDTYFPKISRSLFPSALNFLEVFPGKTINYDTYKTTLIDNFLNIANIDFSDYEHQNLYRIYNRSLTPKECDLMIYINSQFGDYEFSQLISDYIISKCTPMGCLEYVFDPKISLKIYDANKEDIIKINNFIIGRPLNFNVKE